MSKKTVIFDFDGVIHSYGSGWKGMTEIPDPPVDEVVSAIAELRSKGYEVVVVSTRCATEEGKSAVIEYLVKHMIAVDDVRGTKPPAIATVDDRAICFYPGIDVVKAVENFRTWRDTVDGEPVDAVENLARELHEAGRAAVVAGATVAHAMRSEKSFNFIEWDDLNEQAREGRFIQARYLLEKFHITEK